MKLLTLITITFFLGLTTLQAQTDSIPSKENIVLADTNKVIQPREINLDEIKRQIGYPLLAREMNTEGEIIFQILVDEKGNYVRHKVIQVNCFSITVDKKGKSVRQTASGSILIKAIEEHISKIHYTPATLDGKPIESWVRVPFVFKLV